MKQLLKIPYQPEIEVRTHVDDEDVVVLAQDDDIVYIHKNQVRQVIEALEAFLLSCG